MLFWIVANAWATPPADAMVAVRLDHTTYLAMPADAVLQVDDPALQGWLADQVIQLRVTTLHQIRAYLVT